MGERKVLNKYYPPDFDPAKLPRGKRQERNLMTVRMMLPMSVRCKTCGNFMYKGTKFNTRKEDVEGETYLGIQIFRFYYRCTNCAAEFTMKTDPKTSDYIMEEGASRNYEPWRESDALKAEAVRSREEEERGNAMKALENRTKDSKREMDIMEALDEMRSLKARHAGITTEQALAALQQAGASMAEGASGDDIDAAAATVAAAEGADDLPEEDKLAMQQFLLQQKTGIRRLDSDESGSSGDEGELTGRQQSSGACNGSEEAAIQPSSSAAAAANGAGPGPASTAAGAGVPASKPKQPAIKVAVRAKRPAAAADGDGFKKPRQQPAAVPVAPDKRENGSPGDGATAGILGLVGAYGSSSDSEGDN